MRRCVVCFVLCCFVFGVKLDQTAYIAHLTQLTWLDISHTRVSRSVLLLTRLENLQHVGLYCTLVGDEEIAAVALHWTALTVR